MAKRLLKTVLGAMALVAAFAPAACSGFGKWETGYQFFAQAYALFPGILGDYLRVGFYRLTLAECSHSCRISFGSYFSNPTARIGRGVYIGSYCIMGKADIGERTQIASGVQLLSGRFQHSRNEAGEISSSDRDAFSRITIGADCWIGASAIVMANVGDGATVGAGSVVSRPIPPRSVAMGSPARVIRSIDADSECGKTSKDGQDRSPDPASDPADPQ